MNNKKPIHSKYLWFNFLSIMAIVITELSASIEFKEAIGGYTVWLMVAGSAVNFALRFYTGVPIGYNDNNPVERELQSDDNYIKDF